MFRVISIPPFAFCSLDDVRRKIHRAPFTRYLGNSSSVDASVQIHNDIDRRNKDLGCDEDDD